MNSATSNEGDAEKLLMVDKEEVKFCFDIPCFTLFLEWMDDGRVEKVALVTVELKALSPAQ